MRRRIALALSVMTTSIVASVVACSNDDAPQPLNIVIDSGVDIPFDATLPLRDSGNDAAKVDAGADTGTDASDAAADAHDAADAKPDAGFVINGCAAADFADADYTAPDASRVVYFSDSGLVFNPDSGALIQYTPQCMTIKVGESVGWVGNFGFHNLGPNDNNDANPIPNGVDDAGPDGAFWVTFGEAGAFGYQCQQHSQMHGAINVTP